MDKFNREESVEVTRWLEENLEIIDAGKDKTKEPATPSVVSLKETQHHIYGPCLNSFPW